jgi:NitT/TauT family transport system substrate-binding protein
MIRCVAFALFVLGLTSVAAARQTSPPAIRVALVCGVMTPMIAQVAMNDRSFDRAGVRVDKYCFGSGATAAQALARKDVDVFIGSYEHVLGLRVRGFDVKAYAEIFNGGCCTLIAKRRSSVRDLAGLGGRVVGISGKAGLSHTVLVQALESVPRPDRDVTIIGVGQGTPLYAALESGQVAAGMVPEPMLSAFLADGAYKVLYAFNKPFAGNVVMANTSWVRAHGDGMRRLIYVLLKETARVRSDPAIAIPPMSKDFPNIGPRIMLQAIMHELLFVPKDLKVQQDGVQTVSRIELQLGELKAPIPFGQCVDDALIANTR